MLIQTIESGEVGDAVQLPNLSFVRAGSNNPVYAGVMFGADGVIYSYQANGGLSAVGNWLINGTNSDFYLSRTISSGTLESDAGAGPLQMNANRAYRVQDIAFAGSVQATVDFEISDDASGTPVVAMNQYILSATLLP